MEEELGKRRWTGKSGGNKRNERERMCKKEGAERKAEEGGEIEREKISKGKGKDERHKS